MIKRYLPIIVNWLINSGLFYLGWIVTLKYVLQDRYWEGLLVNLGIIVFHIARVPNRYFETLLILTLPLLGSLLVDTSLIFAGIMSYKGGMERWYIAPLWVLSLWALFATSINHSLAWVGRNLWLEIVVGAVGGTLSYLAAVKIGVATFLVSDSVGIACLAIAWGAAIPLSYLYSNFLKRKCLPPQEKFD